MQRERPPSTEPEYVREYYRNYVKRIGKITCETCGAIFQTKHLPRHLATDKHQKYQK